MAGIFSCAAETTNDPWPTIIMIAIVVLVIGAMYFLSNRSQKKRQQETEALLNAIKPGNKVKTIGGICGVVVEVCEDDGTFVLETGTEASGKSYIKFDKQAVYKTDAVVEKTAEKPAETSAPAEEAKAEETAPAEEVKAEETVPAEEAKTEEAPKKKRASRKKAEPAEETPAETEENK
ncbi:MAG: preprotein translocase subunit YajC [Clostridia bacterium]|nr:preprotein translocase subunit YajC [Clostridia bacterium]